MVESNRLETLWPRRVLPLHVGGASTRRGTRPALCACCGLLAFLAVLTMEPRLCAAAETQTADRRVLKAFRVAEPLVIDGRLDEPCWARAETADGFLQLRGRKQAREQTRGRVLFDGRNLYIGLECDEPRMDLVRAAAERNSERFEYYEGETIELFLDVNRDRQTFLQIMLNTNGTVQTYATEAMQISGLVLEHGVCFHKTSFSIECRIPIALLHPGPDPKRRWGINMCRSRMIEGQPGRKVPIQQVHSAWQNPGSGFRDPSQFGELSIDMDFRPFCYDIDVARHDESARIDITNSTGAARNLLFEAVVGEGGKRHARSFALAGGEKRSVKIPMSGTDMEVRVKVRERPGGKVVYLGGTKLQEVSFAIPPEAVTDTVSPTSHYTVFTKHWLERGNHRTLPRPDQRKKPLALFAAPGEYEPASFAVRASKDLGAVQVELAGDLLGENGTVIPTSCVEIRIAELMTRWLDAGTFERVECYLIRNRPLDIPTNTTRRFWLTVLVPPNAVPGQYATKVRIVPANAPAQSLLLRLEVLPVVLSRPEGMNYFMYFNPSFFPPELQSPEHVRRFYLDMRQHGMTTATVYAWPGAKDWISIDRDRNGPMPMATQLDLLRDTGLVADWAAVPWIGAESYRADVWKVVAESARERSWPELLWYLIDEPTDERLPRVEACMKRVANFRARYPELPLRTTTAGASNPKCSHYYDVWIAGCYIDEKTIARGREMGKTIWTYDCGLAPVDAITDRHYFGFWTWAAGLQGASHWAYYDGGARNRWGIKAAWRDSEDDLRDYTHSYNYVYPASGEIIPTIGWEAVREGIDDARYLITLEKHITAARQAGLPEDFVKTAVAALAKVRAAVHVDNLGKERTRCKQMSKETGRSQIRHFERRPPEPALGPADYDRLRLRVAREIAALHTALRAAGVTVDVEHSAANEKPVPPVTREVPVSPVSASADIEQSLVEPCDDKDKVHATYRQPNWDPKGTRRFRVGTITLAKDQKVQGEASIHWVVTQPEIEEKRKTTEGFQIAALDYLYGKLWGEVAVVAFSIKCESPSHPRVYAALNASGASPSTPILERNEITNGWKEIRWDVRDAEIGVSEKWGKIVWLFRFYSRADAFKPGDSLDLYLDNIRLIGVPPKDVTAPAP